MEHYHIISTLNDLLLYWYGVGNNLFSPKNKKKQKQKVITEYSLALMHLSKWILGVGGAHAGHPHDYDKGMSDHTGDFDYSSSLQYHSDIILTLQMVEI